MLQTFRILCGVFLLHAACFQAGNGDESNTNCLVMTEKDEEKKTNHNYTDTLYIITDAVECLLRSPETVASLGRSQVNTFVWKYQQILDIFKEAQEKAWNDFTPKDCPAPLAPSNGGLVCVTIASVRYCKPMCNQGYDFRFMRISRLYEECGRHTGYSWTTQLIGGSRLADCIASSVAVSGQKSAYFNTTENCQQAVAKDTVEKEHVRIFLQELAKKNITELHEGNYDYIICG